MKTNFKFLLFIVISISFILIIILSPIIIIKRKHLNDLPVPDVNIGQIWLRIDTLNPFEPKRIDTVKILEIKNEYALITIDGDTTSREKGTIRRLYIIFK